MSNHDRGQDELLANGRKMLEKGDSWRLVRSYLSLQLSDEVKVNEIIKTLSVMEREGHITIHKVNSKARRNKWNLILGILLMGISIFLFSFFWYTGWIVILPISLFGTGLVVINGGRPDFIFRKR